MKKPSLNVRRRAIWLEQQLANADYFNVHLFLGHPTGYASRKKLVTLDEARAAAVDLVTEYRD